MNDKEFFDILAQQYGIYEAYPDKEYSRIFDAAGILIEPRTSRMLDVGCGTGPYAARLAHAGFQVTGIDISGQSISAAKQRKNNGLNLDFVEGDILHMPFPDNSFDIAFCGAVLHHLPNQLAECAAELHRILTVSGKVFFFEPQAGNINAFLRYSLLSSNRTEEERALTPDEIRQVFERQGFHGFHYHSIQKIRHIYCHRDEGFIKKMFGLCRKLANEHVFPNSFFLGYCQKK